MDIIIGEAKREEIAVATTYCCFCEAYLCERCDDQVHTPPMMRGHDRVKPNKARPRRLDSREEGRGMDIPTTSEVIV